MPNLDGKWTQTQVLYNDIGWYKTPGAPTGVSASTADASSVISFTAPTDVGQPGSITGYRVQVNKLGQTYAVTVAGGVYKIGFDSQPILQLAEGQTYIFDQSDNTNANHPLKFSTTSDGTHGGGTEYTTGVTYNGVPGNAGAYTQIVVAEGAPTLYYYCGNHSGMGGTAQTPTNPVQEVTGSSSPITVSSLVNDSDYSFDVAAQNIAGYGPAGTATATPTAPQQAIYQIPGTYSWVAPNNLTPSSVSVVCIGGGGGAGGYGGGGGGAGLAYGNTLGVTAGQSYTVQVGDGSAAVGSGSTAAQGGDSYFNTSNYLRARGGYGGQANHSGSASGGAASPASSGTALSGGGQGGAGGACGPRNNNWAAGGGGGAGGYSGNGGTGGAAGSGYANNGSAGSGGAGGGGGGGSDPTNTGYGYGGGGGGTGIFGEGTSGDGGVPFTDGRSSGAENEGHGGSGGGDGSNTFSGYGYDTVANGGANLSGSSTPVGGSGGQYGGGGANGYRKGASGVVRIVWSRTNQTRTFPSTNVGDF